MHTHASVRALASISVLVFTIFAHAFYIVTVACLFLLLLRAH